MHDKHSKIQKFWKCYKNASYEKINMKDVQTHDQDITAQ